MHADIHLCSYSPNLTVTALRNSNGQILVSDIVQGMAADVR